jgi:hypothetical protein
MEAVKSCCEIYVQYMGIEEEHASSYVSLSGVDFQRLNGMRPSLHPPKPANLQSKEQVIAQRRSRN